MARPSQKQGLVPVWYIRSFRDSYARRSGRFCRHYASFRGFNPLTRDLVLAVRWRATIRCRPSVKTALCP